MARQIVRLSMADRDRAVATLTAAFHNDPAMVHMLPDRVTRPRRLTRLFGWMFGETVKHGLVLGTPRAEVVTLWRLPGAVHLHEPPWHPGALRFVPIFGRHLPRALRVDAGIQTNLPPDEDWLYLKIAGVRPDCQGKGLGGLAIRSGLERGAVLGVPAVLETATPSNVGLYQRLGFVTRREWDVPRGGPHFWSMARDADDPDQIACPNG